VFVVKPAAAQANAQPAAPQQAQQGQQGQAAAPADIAERRFVRVGEAREDRVVVLEGVAEGEQVVTSGQLKLQNGARVKVDNSAPLTAPAVRPKL
jgi:membrane fusion protein (multidrug efflux system)